MSKHKVLFAGSRNGSRSFMAEAFLNPLSDDRYEAESAGFEAGDLDSMAVEVMREIGIDISRERTKQSSPSSRKERCFRALSPCATARTRNGAPSFPATSIT